MAGPVCNSQTEKGRPLAFKVERSILDVPQLIDSSCPPCIFCFDSAQPMYGKGHIIGAMLHQGSQVGQEIIIRGVGNIPSAKCSWIVVWPQDFPLWPGRMLEQQRQMA